MENQIKMIIRTFPAAVYFLILHRLDVSDSVAGDTCPPHPPNPVYCCVVLLVAMMLNSLVNILLLTDTNDTKMPENGHVLV